MEEQLDIKQEEIVEEESFKDRILSHKVLSYFYDSDPKKTILNICSYSLQSDPKLDFARQKAMKLFKGMHFRHLYGESPIDWLEYFNKTMHKMQNTYVAPKYGERISNFIVQKDVRKVPQNLWTIPSKNQKIKEEEFIFILKTINFKILKNWKIIWGNLENFLTSHFPVNLQSRIFDPPPSKRNIGKNCHSRARTRTRTHLRTHVHTHALARAHTRTPATGIVKIIRFCKFY